MEPAPTVAFLPGEPPRTSEVVFHRADGQRRLPLGQALPTLLLASQDPAAPTVTAYWGQVAAAALRLVARERVVPGPDAWRIGPLDDTDLAHLRSHDGDVPEPVRAFLDAVVDSLAHPPVPEESAGEVRISLRLVGEPDPTTLRLVPQVHSVSDPALVVDARELWQEVLAGFVPQARLAATVALQEAARMWQPLAGLLDGAVPDDMALSDDEVTELLTEAAGRLAAAGVAVHWPADLSRDLTSRALVAGQPPTTDPAAIFGDAGLLEFRWQIALGGQPLTRDELNRLAEARRPVVRLRDRWVLVHPTLAARARRPAMAPVRPAAALGAALTGAAQVDGEHVEVAAAGWLRQLRDAVADLARGGEPPLPPPAGLAATLRDYQRHGFSWLARMTSLGLGACLADDMGLGKTVTLIALHLHRRNRAVAGPTLVVCPASLLANWEREIARFAPGTPVRRFHGHDRTLDGVADGFVLTTYATMRLDPGPLREHRWDLVVADEAQHVKNARSHTARALRRIPSAARVALTGTPVENNLSELWAVLDWATPGLLGPLAAFRTRFAAAVESGGDPTAADQFARLVRPFLLRRRKVDPGIAPELPPKTETDQPVALTVEQAALYEAVVRETMAQIRDSSDIQRRGLVLKLLTALKQICNHPAQYLREPHPRLAGRSGKLELLDELLDTILAADGAVLVFTQYVAMGRLIARHLSRRGLAAPLLHGGVPVPARQELVDAFERGGSPVLLLSLRAAGTGLNLTRADHVIHYDRWWNPAVEDQATDRAYRIGQTRPVQVHRLVTEGTVEDRIATMLGAKRQLADAVLATGESAWAELSDPELADLVELRRSA